MRLNARWFRGLILLTLLLQSAGGALVRLRHMTEEAEAFAHVDHLQTEGSGVCVTHDDSCRICRSAQTSLLNTQVCVRLYVETSPYLEQLGYETTALPSHGSLLPVGSRAPPRI
ncbi:MAG: hypothetical protein ACREMA_05175 [Longimicrobiales bacterium]